MKIAEIRQLSQEELANELTRMRRHLFDLRAQSVTEKLEDSSLIRKTRQDIARFLTVQNERNSGK